LRWIGPLFVKGAVRADPRAKWDVDIDVPARIACRRGLSIVPSPIESNIAARLFRSIAFLIVSIGCAATWPGGAIAHAQNVAPPPPPPPAPTPSVVYRAHNQNAIHDFRTNPELVRRMTNALVLAVTHQPDVASAWRSLVRPNDRIGIKISAAGGELFTTHREIVNTIVDGLVAAGHSRRDIIVWDRSLAGIQEAGYTASEGYQLKSIPPRDGYDAKATYSAPFLGNLIWGDFEYLSNGGQLPLLSETENTSSVSHFSKIVANEVTKIINLPVLSDNVRTAWPAASTTSPFPTSTIGAASVFRRTMALPAFRKFITTHISDKKSSLT
jgi:hypothetical protein